MARVCFHRGVLVVLASTRNTMSAPHPTRAVCEVVFVNLCLAWEIRSAQYSNARLVDVVCIFGALLQRGRRIGSLIVRVRVSDSTYADGLLISFQGTYGIDACP